MKNIFNVALFSMKSAMRKKSFWISNIIIMVIIFFIFNIIHFQFGNYVLQPKNEDNNSQNVVSTPNNEISSEPVQEPVAPVKNPNILIIDTENILGDYVRFMPTDIARFGKTTSSLDEVKTKIKNDEINSVVNLYHDKGSLKFDYIILQDDFGSTKEANYVSTELQKIYFRKTVEENNIPQDVINKIKTEVSYEITPLEANVKISVAIILGMLISFILFMSIYLYGHSVSLSIASEKDTRVIETLVTSAKPFQIILGKTLGMGLLGLIQLIVIILFTMFCYHQYIPDGIDIVNIYFKDINLSVSSTIFICIYFILGYNLYAFLNAIIGSIVSKAEDVPTASLPLSFTSLICFYLSFFTIDSVSTKINTFVSQFPLSSPFSMPAKIVANLVSTPEIVSSLLLLSITSILFAFIAIRIYSVAILHYGNKMKLKDILNVFIKIH